MRFGWLALPVLAVALAAGCTSDPRTTTTPETKVSTGANEKKPVEPAKEAPSEDEATPFNKARQYDDGLKVEVVKIDHSKIGEFASGGKPGGDKTVFTIRVTNGAKKAFDASLVSPTLTYGKAGAEAEPVFDDTGEGFTGKILSGKAMTAKWAFAIPKTELGDVTMQVGLGSFDHDDAIFTGSAKS